jgi:hypothetical protein
MKDSRMRTPDPRAPSLRLDAPVLVPDRAFVLRLCEESAQPPTWADSPLLASWRPAVAAAAAAAVVAGGAAVVAHTDHGAPQPAKPAPTTPVAPPKTHGPAQVAPMLPERDETRRDRTSDAPEAGGTESGTPVGQDAGDGVRPDSGGPVTSATDHASDDQSHDQSHGQSHDDGGRDDAHHDSYDDHGGRGGRGDHQGGTDGGRHGGRDDASDWHDSHDSHDSHDDGDRSGPGDGHSGDQWGDDHGSDDDFPSGTG